MTANFEFVEAQTKPICPYCDAALQKIEYEWDLVPSMGLLGAPATWVVILTCPECHKILGTRSSAS